MVRARRVRKKTRPDKTLAPLRRHLDDLYAKGQAKEAIDLAYDIIVKLSGSPPTPASQSSERVDPGALAQQLLQFETDGVLAEVEAIQVDDDRAYVDDLLGDKPDPCRSRHGRGKLPDELPRETIIIPVADADRDCPGCGRQRRLIGYDTSEVLEFVPAHFKVIAYHREQRGCLHCLKAIATAPVADKIYDRAMAGPDLLSHVAMARYGDHLPFDRQSRIFARLGCAIATSTLCGWVARVTADLQPIADLIFDRARSAYLLQTDATGLPVLDRDVEANIRLGTLWFYVGDRRDVAVRYTETAHGATGPWLHLAGREGYILADAANVLDRAFNGKAADAIEVGCLAHARRRFVALLDAEPEASRAVEFFQLIYAIEKIANQRALTHEARKILRQQRTRPLMDKLKRWAEAMRGRYPPASALRKAVNYLLNHWTALTRFLDDARLPLDNNETERQIRIVALDRKNSLFAGSHAGAERAAVMYSIICTCLLAGVNPQAYIADVLVKVAGGWPAARLEELLPYRWAEVHRGLPGG